MKVAFIQLKPECNLGVMYIASAINEEVESSIFIQQYEEDIVSAVCSYNPDIIAFPAFSGEYKKVLKICNLIKKRMNVYSVFGGAHPTYYPEIIKDCGVDALCRGEGESAMLELVRAKKNGKKFCDIKNFYFNINNKIIKNPLRPLNDSIDSIKFPDRDIYSKYFYINGFKNNIAKRVISGRGCPFNCSYCFNHALKKIYLKNGVYIRIRSVENVIKELIFLKRKYNPSDFYFVDDIFGMQKEWLDKFSEKYKKYINLPFSCLCHINYINDRYVELLKDAGCKLIIIGIETGNEEYRNKILKRNYTNKILLKAVSILHQHKIKFYAFNILLLPGETLRNALETIEINKKCKPFSSDVMLYQPFIGTELAEYSIQNKYYIKELNDIPDNLFTDSILINKDKKKILRLFHIFQICVKYSIPNIIIKILINLPLENIYRRLHNHYKEEIRKKHLYQLNNINKDLTLIDYVKSIFYNKKDISFINYYKNGKSEDNLIDEN